MAHGRGGGDGGEDRAMRQPRDVETEMGDLLVRGYAPQPGAIRFGRPTLTRKRDEGDRRPGDAIRAALEDDVAAP